MMKQFTIAVIGIIMFALFSSIPATAQIEMSGSDGNVSIGTTPSTSYKLNLEYNLSSSSRRGLYLLNTGTANVNAYGLEVNNSANPGYGFGGRFYGGKVGLRSDATAVGSGSRYGFWSYASNGTSNYGIVGQAVHNSSGTSYAVWGAVINDPQNNSWAGYFDGNVYTTGQYLPSDGRLKEGQRNMNGRGFMDKLKQLTPISYRYKRGGEFEDINLPPGERYGFLAEDVEEIFPELIRTVRHVVHSDPDLDEPERNRKIIEFKSMNYIELIPLLMQAIQEQQEEIDELRSIILDR